VMGRAGWVEVRARGQELRSLTASRLVYVNPMRSRRKAAHRNRHCDVVTAGSKPGATHHSSRGVPNLRSDARWSSGAATRQKAQQRGHTSPSSAHTLSDSIGVPDCFTFNSHNPKENPNDHT